MAQFYLWGSACSGRRGGSAFRYVSIVVFPLEVTFLGVHLTNSAT